MVLRVIEHYRLLTEVGKTGDSIALDLKRVGCGGWVDWLIWLRMGTGGGILWKRHWAFGFHKMCGVSWLAENVLASQESLSSVRLVSAFGNYCMTAI